MAKNNNTNITDKQSVENTKTIVRAIYERIGGFNKRDIDDIIEAAVKAKATGMTDEDIVTTILPNTTAYRKRFSGNEMLLANKQAPLTESVYLAYEREMQQLLNSYADVLPPELKDSNDKLRNLSEFVPNWIAAGLAPRELEQRILVAQDFAKAADPNLKKALRDFYGISESQIAQWALSSDKANTMKLLQRQAASQIGAEALNANLNISATLAESIVEKEISAGQARQSFQKVAAEKETFDLLGGLEGTRLTQAELIKGELGLDIDAAKAKEKVINKEASRFSGSGAGTSILGNQTGGQF
jgi:hypothetical protein